MNYILFIVFLSPFIHVHRVNGRGGEQTRPSAGGGRSSGGGGPLMMKDCLTGLHMPKWVIKSIRLSAVHI
jgi:hypothetical protein